MIDRPADRNRIFFSWGLRPQTPGIYRFRARMDRPAGRLLPPRIIPAAGPALRSHPCGAVSSAQVMKAYQIPVPVSSPAHGSILQVLRAKCKTFFNVRTHGCESLRFGARLTFPLSNETQFAAVFH